MPQKKQQLKLQFRQEISMSRGFNQKPDVDNGYTKSVRYPGIEFYKQNWNYYWIEMKKTIFFRNASTKVGKEMWKKNLNKSARMNKLFVPSGL